MPRGRPTDRTPGPGRLGPVLAVAALIIAACSSGSSAPPPPAEPAAATEPTQSSAAAEPPPEPAADPAAQDEPNGEAGGRADASGAEPAGSAGDEPPDAQDLVETPPADLSADMEAGLRALLDELAQIARTWIPAGRVAVAVVTPDGTLYGLNEHRQHISASAVKPLWAAAAIDLAGLEAVVPLADAALVRSDNFAAGEIIDLIGIDTVNDWGRDVAGATGTHLAAWYFGGDRVAQSVLAGGTRGNLTTVADLALFYARLRRGELLDPDGVAALEGWLRATPRGSSAPGAVNGALLARLPESAAAEATHKTGWLPPYCCRADLRLIIDAGIVPLPGGGWFAIAAVSDRGAAYNLSVDWVALAACRVYVLLGDDTAHACGHAGDGTPRPELWPEPDPEEVDGSEAPAGGEEADPAPPEGEETPPGDEPGPETEEPTAEPA